MSTIKVNTLLHSDGTSTTEPSIPALDQRMASAWVNFDGTGVVAIADSYNVSSLTDVAVGRWTVNFTTTMSNANYAVNIANKQASGSQLKTAGIDEDNLLTTSGFGIIHEGNVATDVDITLVCAIVLGGQ